MALQKYPIQVSDMDKGILETNVIKGHHIWRPPHDMRRWGSGLRCKLKVQIIKGEINGRTAIKVSIHKELTLKRDFFSDVESIPSDGLEEASILYRIDRELQIDKALERFQQRSSGHSIDYN